MQEVSRINTEALMKHLRKIGFKDCFSKEQNDP